jgi:proline racemase/trans-L-3-hydroxyproline dehydratase
VRIQAVDYHTAGEPFRIVTGGVDPLPGGTILDKRRFAAAELDDVRKLLVFEPRGHADMYGCFVTEPEDEGADLGVVFFHNAGYSTACGHGTIALATYAVDAGLVEAREPETELVVDVPSGRLPVLVSVEAGRPVRARFRNVPAFVFAEGLDPYGADVAYGGAFYAFVPASAVGHTVAPENVTEFIRLGREVKRELEAAHEIVHPDEPELRDIYGVVFWQAEGGDTSGLVQRNITVFADGEVDRSPCGSATSARLALLDAKGELSRGATLLHRSVIGSEFESRVVGEAEAGLVTEVAGSAHRTGVHEFVLDERDELGTGFLLR